LGGGKPVRSPGKKDVTSVRVKHPIIEGEVSCGKQAPLSPKFCLGVRGTDMGTPK